MRSLGHCQWGSFCSYWQYISFQMIFAMRKNNMQIQASLPFISPLGSPPCTTRRVPSAGSPSFKCRSAPALLVQSLSCSWEVAVGFFFFLFTPVWARSNRRNAGTRGKLGVGGRQRILEGNRGYFGCKIISWPHPA